jgi:acyl transferase domain-containing protein
MTQDDKRMQAVEVALRNFEVPSRSNGQQAAPADNVPKVGRIAGEAITRYASELADFIEKNAGEMVEIAQRLQTESKEFADRIRAAAHDQSSTIMGFTAKMQQAGDDMAAAREKFIGVEMPQ